MAEIWIDSDWSGGQWAAMELLDADAVPGELVLQANPACFVLAFDATDFSGIWDLAVWQGHLYLAAGPNPPMMSDGGDILVYDYASNSCSLDYSVFEQGIVVLKVHDGVIFSPGVDSMGSHNWGNIYLNDGSGWIRKETVPFALHVHDAFFHDNKIWITTGQSFPDYRGGLFYSEDLGETWEEEFAVHIQIPDTNHRRIYGATVFEESIIIQPDFQIPEGAVLFELQPGGTVVEHELGLHSEGIAGFQEFHGQLFCWMGNALYVFDGSSFSEVDPPVGSPSFATRGMIVFQDRLYLGGQGHIFFTDDGQIWNDTTIDQNAGRIFETLETAHGRLYSGSNPNGEVFVTSVPEYGNLESELHCFAAPAGGGLVTWQALLQGPDTRISFQIRSAENESDLFMAEFVGPDGTTASWYEISGTALAAVHNGDTCFQYQVQLESSDERFAPVLQEFKLEVSDLLSGVGNIQVSVELKAQPNPFNPQTTISWRQLQNGAASVIIFDISGRQVVTLVNGTKPAGKCSVVWNGSDDYGKKQAAGIYLVEMRQKGMEKVLKLVLVP